MRVAIFSTRPYDRQFLDEANAAGEHEFTYLEPRLDALTARTAEGAQAVCLFVNDVADEAALRQLAAMGVRLIALRCAGFNNVDMRAAEALGMAVCRVPEYSPHAVAEHTVALMLMVNRQLHRAWARVREGNFALEGLLGFDLHGRTVGLVGTGKIGLCVARIMRGFGCRVMAFDPRPDAAGQALGLEYVTLDELFAESHIVSLHCPLTPQTHHMINDAALARMRRGVMLVNTSRGGVIDTPAVIRGLKTGQVGSLALDVYEEEGDLFFRNLSDHGIADDTFARLLTFPNVVITGHQAFFTREALQGIAQTTLHNLSSFAATGRPAHPVTSELLR
jgi:D-lactate dehydrogenase